VKARSVVEIIRAYNEGEPLRKLETDHPRDTCEWCGASYEGGTFLVLTVVDVLGHESAVCLSCWREQENARRARGSER
jgi:hypothetical protein